MPLGAVLFKGPGSLRVETGSISILGYPVEKGETLVIPAGRSIPGLLDESTRYAYTGKVTGYSIDDYKRINEIAGRMIEYDRIILIGPSDSGKSTLASWIVNRMVLEGKRTLYATIDIGQNEAFCPAFASSMEPKPPMIPGVGGPLYRACFTGSFTPRDRLPRYHYCAVEIIEGWRGSLIIDTDGWVSLWNGLESKVSIARITRVDAVVTIGLGESEASFLKGKLPGASIVRVPRLVRGSKSKSERRTHRERLIAKALIEARERPVDLESTLVYGLPLFHGTPIDSMEASKLIGARVVYAEQQDGGLVAVVRGRMPEGRVNARLLREGWERGLIASVSIGGSPNPAIVTRIDYRRRILYIASNARGEPDYVEVGVARVDPDAILGRAKW